MPSGAPSPEPQPGTSASAESALADAAVGSEPEAVYGDSFSGLASRRSFAGCAEGRASQLHRGRTQQMSDAQMTLKQFLSSSEGSSLRAWFKHFDRDQNGRISFVEFTQGMEALNYNGDLSVLWEELDQDGSGEITFDEISKGDAKMWNVFRRWCGSRFQNGRDMVRQLKRAAVAAASGNAFHSKEDVLIREEFCAGIRFKGWHMGFEDFLFTALDLDSEGCISARDAKWIESEARRHQQKEDAKRYVMRRQHCRALRQRAGQVALADFKAFLRHHFGPLFIAWRRVLDNDGSMTVFKADLFKVCRTLNWRGDVRALWKALDFDNSGVTTLEELDPHSAQVLAQFHEWATMHFGPRFKSALFSVFDRQKRKKIGYAHFVRECESRGFRGKAKTIAVWLDWQEKRYLVEDDFAIFDVFKPPPWLTATPDYQGAEDFKRLLLKRYGHHLKAWRCVLDKDNSNFCNWHEFQEAAKHMKYGGDVAGVWLALDRDLSGFITLKELDADAHHALLEFRLWADDEFGGVRSAFKVLDADKSGELTYREFRAACRNFGFTGDLRRVFQGLDMNGEGKLAYKEVNFLDDWEVHGLPDSAGGDVDEADRGRSREHDASSSSANLVGYFSFSPGPGAYNIPSSFGAAPTMPIAKHGGSYSFTCRRPWLSLTKTVAKATVGPADYEPGAKLDISRKPAWTFGRGVRPASRGSGAASPALSGRRVPAPPPSPGPGQYDTATESNGPRFSMRPRRVLLVHPDKEREKGFSSW